jgi:hypothetical protein
MKVLVGAIFFWIVVQISNIYLQSAADNNNPVAKQWEQQLYKGKQ